MPVKAQVMGPGTFTVGTGPGTLLDLTAQVTSLKVTPSAEAEDAIPTLSGETLAGERTYAWTVSGTLVQDLTADGMMDFTWAEAGQEHPFSFTPSTAAGRTVSGVVVVDPLEIGGDVKKKNTVDFEWEVVGTPTLGDDL